MLEHIKKIARWYFDEWISLTSGVGIEQVEIKLAEAINRYTAPLMVLAKDTERLVGAAELKIHEMGIYPDYEFWVGGVYVDIDYTEDLTGGFYSRFGFEPIEIIEHKGYKVLVMAADLRS